MFGNKNKITFCASEIYEGNLEPIIPAYRQFPEWYGKSKTTSKCPFKLFFEPEKEEFKIPDGNVNLNDLISNFHSSEQKKINQSNSIVANPMSLTRDTTVVNCPGVTDFLRTGYILPCWSDISFRYFNGKVIYNSSDNFPDTQHGVHVNEQYIGMDESQSPLMGGFHKVSTPWFIKTTPGVSVLITDPFWDRNKIFTTVSAVVHPDKTPIQLKWFFEFNKNLPDSPNFKNMDEQIIKRKTPLVLLIPFKREKFTHNFEYLSTSEMNKFYRNITSQTVSWISETVYNRARKQIGNLYK